MFRSRRLIPSSVALSVRVSAIALAAMLACATPGRAATLYERLGGQPGLEKIVESATSIWTTDPRISSTFEETNLLRFKRSLVQQLCQLSGGGCEYKGQTMYAAHKGLHIDTRQFNVLVEGLQTAMDRQEISFSVQNRLLALLAPMHRDVVTR